MSVLDHEIYIDENIVIVNTIQRDLLVEMEVNDGSVVKASVSETWSALCLIRRSWIQIPVGLNLGFVILLYKS